MTPKEKAQELVLKFAFKGAQHEGEAKKFALIAVDEIINCDNYFKTLADAKEFINYWHEVQQEIEKL